MFTVEASVTIDIDTIDGVEAMLGFIRDSELTSTYDIDVEELHDLYNRLTFEGETVVDHFETNTIYLDGECDDMDVLIACANTLLNASGISVSELSIWLTDESDGGHKTFFSSLGTEMVCLIP